MTDHEIDIIEEASAPEVDTEKLRRTLTAILTSAGETTSELSFSIVDDETIRGLSRQYLNRDRATDVLSFPQRETQQPKGGHLGDIVVSIETARRQAETAGHSVDEEVCHLAEHGLLHLYGYDHDEANCRDWNRAAVELGLSNHVMDVERGDKKNG